MLIPARVTEIQDDLHFGLSIPSFIKKLTFPEGSQCTRMGNNSIKNAASITLVDLSNCAMLSIIGSGSFQNCSLLESIIFPSSLNQIGAYVFMADSSLTSITWNSWNGTTNIDQYAFGYTNTSEGTVLVTNPIGSNNSEALLAVLKTKGLPRGWTVAS